MQKQSFINFITLVLFLVCANSAFAQTTAFTYQGKLNDSGSAVNGTYQFQFKLYDAASGGNQIGQTLTDIPATVTNGVFAVSLDFGAAGFDGAERFLEVGVRAMGSPDPYSLLNPRHSIASVPYAIKSLKANEATTAQTATTADNTTNLGGVPAQQFVQTTDSRMSDAREPLAGSTNYIQNTTNQQSSSNFNISGEGKANKFNAVTQYDIKGNRVLSVAGTDNAFVGINAGKSTTGGYNAFVGADSGKENTTGFYNSFFGAYSGRANTIGTSNSFVGANAGLSNTTGGSNSFFGTNAGFSNTTGLFNSFFGTSAGANVNNAGSNSMFGAKAGENTTAGGNSYFGAFAGQKNTTGFSNVFLGLNAGKENTGGSYNTFVGTNSGQNAGAVGNNNTTLGYNAKVGLNINNATAIGANAVATENNTVVLGSPNTQVSLSGLLKSTAGASFGNSVDINGETKMKSLVIGEGPENITATFENGEGSINTKFIFGYEGYFSGAVQGSTLRAKTFSGGGTGLVPLCAEAVNPQNPFIPKVIKYCQSSLRYKENVENYIGGLKLVQNLRPVTFNWKSNGTMDLGFIAEEVEQLEPRFTFRNEDNQVEGVRYQLLTVSLVSAIQEQQEQIKEQRDQIKEQRDQIKEQRDQIEALKAIVCNNQKDASVCKK